MLPSHMFRLSGTVILRIWWQVLLVIIYTTGWLIFINRYEHEWVSHFKQPFISVFGVATALLLVFRTNTAYDRYYEGRNLWSKLSQNIRTLARCIWVVVAEKEKNRKEVADKTIALNLLVAFAYATRNHLREDYSYQEKELHELIKHLPMFEKIRSSGGHNEKISRLDSSATATTTPTKSEGTQKTLASRKFVVKAFDTPVPNNIPIEISHHIATYIDSVRRRELVDVQTTIAMNNALNCLIECLCGFERILRTPIPLAYSVHLHQSTWLYLLVLPFQLFEAFNWFTIPAVALASFALLGILGIGREIENPFGYDVNDLPLDDVCHTIKREAQNLINCGEEARDLWASFETESSPASCTTSDPLKVSSRDVKNMPGTSRSGIIKSLPSL